MANHASAIKRHKQSEKRRAINSAVKSGIKTAVKKVRESIAAGKSEELAGLLSTAVSTIDSAVSKGVLHRNNASRKISGLTTSVRKTVKDG
ncbi:MAG: 30S ribosomal protein S20 [Deltaproteobacteria bacterium]|nr:30S ribosomal protein S20 [Deltaproteobacteria bacterium]